MNFQCSPVLKPLKVLMVFPLCPTGRLTSIKIMSGLAFGMDQLVDLILLVNFNELSAAEELKLELFKCAFSCMNSITVSSDFPHISDADFFCFFTNLKNPNSVDFHEIDSEQFEMLYWIFKIANSLSSEPEKPEPTQQSKKAEVPVMEEKQLLKPVIMTDGIVIINVLKFFIKNISSDVFFCPTPLPVIAKNVLGDQLKVLTSDINSIFVWAANDEVFHIEVEKPILIRDKFNVKTDCDWNMIGKKRLQTASLDHTDFNESWLKKEFIKKVEITASKNPYGSIYRASEFVRTLNIIWKTRTADARKINVFANVGVISDGSLGTIKGFAYVLPLIFTSGTWSVNTRFKESFHLKQELKRMNKAVKDFKEKFIPFCKKFLEEDVEKEHVALSEDTESTYTYNDKSGGRLV